jgi:hypothetical protein
VARSGQVPRLGCSSNFAPLSYLLLSGSVPGEVAVSKKQELSKKRELEGARDERVYRAAERLRELRASGVEPSEILGGPAGATFVCGDCEGDPDLAQAAFALVYSSKSQSGRPSASSPFGC